MATFIIIDDVNDSCAIYDTNTEAEIAKARAMLKLWGVDCADEYVGDHEESYKNGNKLFAAT